MRPDNYLTIDVEDYFQVSAFEDIVTRGDWNNFESRVEKNTYNILSLLDKLDIKATFFVLGWTASKFPQIVREIQRLGHEIGCHSYLHRLVYNLTPEEFRDDTKRAKDVLEEIINGKVEGYRAPSYSITEKSLWALPILRELGFSYDSSVFPIHHDRYGVPGAPRFPFLWKLNGSTPEVAQEMHFSDAGTIQNRNFKEVSGNGDTDSTLLEFPISTSLFLGRKIPVSGGGYFRIFPYWFTKYFLDKINKRERRPFVFYLHPWEIDPDQPRFKSAKILSKFRHYNNLSKTPQRFGRLLEDFSFGPMGSHRFYEKNG